MKFFKAVIASKLPPFDNNEEEYCPGVYAIIEEELESVGSVVAQVYSVAIGEVEVQGKGNGCADADTSGTAESIAFAAIVAKAIAIASHKHTVAQADAFILQKQTIFASAFAQAYANACLEGEGSATAEADSLATAVAKPIATLGLLLVAEVDCTGQDGFAVSLAEAENKAEESSTVDSNSSSTVDGKGSADSGSEGSASTKSVVVKKCTKTRHKACCREYEKSGAGALRRAICRATKVDSEEGVHLKFGDTICECDLSH